MTNAEKIKEAIAIGFDYGGYDGAHHKAWTIDQMLRVLLGDKYDKFVAEYENGEDGPKTFEWDCGIAP